MTAIKNSVVLVTGGSRGIGKELVEQLYQRGASKVYATARDPKTVTHPDAIALALEVTDPKASLALAGQAKDVTILINNAGGRNNADFLTSSEEEIRHDLEINYYGPLWVTRAFVPVIEANGGGHILNVHSVLSWYASPGGVYSASKAAIWSQSNSLRLELLPRGITVTGLHVGHVDTELAAHISDSPKIAPSIVAAKALDGIESGAYEVLVDEISQKVKGGLAAPLEALYPQLAK